MSRFEEAMCSRKFRPYPSPGRLNVIRWFYFFCQWLVSEWASDPLLAKNVWGKVTREFSEWLFSMRRRGSRRRRSKRRKEALSFYFEFSWIKAWCLELKQPFCDHVMKIKRITEKLTQNPDINCAVESINFRTTYFQICVT